VKVANRYLAMVHSDLKNVNFQRHASESKTFQARTQQAASPDGLKINGKSGRFNWAVDGSLRVCFCCLILMLNAAVNAETRVFRWLLASSRASCKKKCSTAALRLHSRSITQWSDNK